ncbi:hypothetical protein PUN28_009335 [Cardiocondyla obscurior]|uniref:Uncharacterized protein n=1 Tax=Cardiocondyla obscurior TaxID=286306 RepID=A0AAW2FXA3_9HYME
MLNCDHLNIKYTESNYYEKMENIKKEKKNTSYKDFTFVALVTSILHQRRDRQFHARTSIRSLIYPP